MAARDGCTCWLHVLAARTRRKLRRSAVRSRADLFRYQGSPLAAVGRSPLRESARPPRLPTAEHIEQRRVWELPRDRPSFRNTVGNVRKKRKPLASSFPLPPSEARTQ